MQFCILLLTLAVGSKAILPPGVAPMEDADDVDIFADNEPQEFGDTVTTESPTGPRAGSATTQKCGIRKEVFFKATINKTDEQAHFAEFNWAVPIFDVLWDGTENYTCVGSLIHPQVVLTVAHYFTQKKNLLVRAGDWNLTSTGEFHKHQSVYVSSVEIHPKFRSRKLKFDVALLFLSSPVTTASNVGFACLPPAKSVTPPGAECIVTGWGKKQFEGGEVSDVLKLVEVPALSNRDCEDRLRPRLGQAFNMHKTWMCAGGEAGVDACLQDGGGPLVCPYSNSDDQYYQAGIVSWGHGCGIDGVPGVYTNVAEVRQWIDDQMVAKGYNSDTYTA